MITPSQNLTADFYANRAQLLILSWVLHHPRRTGWCDPHSAAPRWRWEKEMYGYNGQIRWGVSSTAPLCSCNAHDEKDLSAVLVHHTPSPAGSNTRRGCTCTLSFSSIKQWNGWGEKKFQQTPITQLKASTPNRTGCAKRVLTCWKGEKRGRGEKGREREKREMGVEVKRERARQKKTEGIGLKLNLQYSQSLILLMSLMRGELEIQSEFKVLFMLNVCANQMIQCKTGWVPIKWHHPFEMNMFVVVA